MKLDYNILWIDDTPKWVESIESPLKEHFDELGYRLKITLEKNGANIVEAIKNPELDLIIVDYRLPKITGKDLIETIRKKHVLVEIVFYSQEGNPKDKFDTPPDGVYFTAREDAEERITAVIDLTLKKSQDINNIRGLVIAETIDIRSRGNKNTELALVRLFRKHRIIGWRRHQQILGKPDFIFRKLRLAIFVDGCFWHGCSTHSRHVSKSGAYWRKKLATNQARDRLVTRTLRRKGWRVLRIWEHDLARKSEARLLRRLRMGGHGLFLPQS